MQQVEIVIDVLSNSIINSVTGEVFDTEILKVTDSDKKLLRKGWNFDWIGELKRNDVYKLTTVNNHSVIQGLISLKDNKDHIAIPLIENADFNIGKNKVYKGVAGNLFAFACKVSFEKNYNGYVAFYAKSNLIDYYHKALGAEQVGASQLMVLDNEASLKLVNLKLVNQYFKT